MSFSTTPCAPRRIASSSWSSATTAVSKRGTPLWTQLESRVYEKDWQKFDGLTPTVTHPNVTGDELRFLLGTAYSRFYMRPSFLANYLGVRRSWARDMVGTLDRRVSRRHTRVEIDKMSRPVTC